MSALQYINITAEVLCISICLILLLCMLTTEYRKEKLNRIFISVVCCLIPLLITDMTIFIFEGSTTPHRKVIFKIAYFLSFILGTALLISFTRYILTFVKMKTTVSRATVTASNTAIALSGVNIIFIILTQFNGMYYYIDGDNLFRPGDWYLVSQLSALLCIAINTGIMLAHQKHFGKREKVFMLSYAAFPALAIIIQNMVDGTIASIDVAATLTILIFYSGIQSEQGKRLKEKEVELANSRIDIMLSQIQPHFIYNSLVSIQRLCTKDPKQAEETVKEFTRYLRGNLESLSISKPISFANELLHLESYLAIEKKRFGERLNIKYDITADNFYLPALTLQPIAENAVRHGVTKKDEGGTVTIRTHATQTDNIITVVDDGVGFDINEKKQDDRHHVGIENVRCRLSAMCGGTLTVSSRPGNGTTAIITIPKGE